MMEREIAVRIEDVTFGYGQRTVFSALNLLVRRGEVLLVQGANGVGKTTFLDLVAGAKHPRHGTVDNRSERVEYLHQDYVRSLFPWHNVAWNICIRQLAENRIHASAIYHNAQELCKLMDVVLPLYELPFRLSGGQKHLVTLLRSFAGFPDLLLLDEPGAGLDEENARRFWATLGFYKSRHPDLTIICAVHSVPSYISLQHRIACLSGSPCQVEICGVEHEHI